MISNVFSQWEIPIHTIRFILSRFVSLLIFIEQKKRNIEKKTHTYTKKDNDNSVRKRDLKQKAYKMLIQIEIFSFTTKSKLTLQPTRLLYRIEILFYFNIYYSSLFFFLFLLFLFFTKKNSFGFSYFCLIFRLKKKRK